MERCMNLCVYCGSAMGDDPEFARVADEFGREIARHGDTLVYGGGSIGIMGVVADACLDEGGKVIGVIPGFLSKVEVPHTGLTELIVTETMSKRKDIMMELADAYVLLPGGFGSMEEFFQTLVSNQITDIIKPLGILNVNGYYDPLLGLLSEIIGHGFAPIENETLFVVGQDIPALIEGLDNYSPQKCDKFKTMLEK